MDSSAPVGRRIAQKKKPQGKMTKELTEKVTTALANITKGVNDSDLYGSNKDLVMEAAKLIDPCIKLIVEQIQQRRFAPQLTAIE
jgi:hypothetical protein